MMIPTIFTHKLHNFIMIMSLTTMLVKVMRYTKISRDLLKVKIKQIHEI